MAVDTLSKRSASLRFGMSHLAGTRPPSGSIPEFERAALLGCYYIEPPVITFGDPEDGWIFGADETVWTFGADSVVWMFAADETVWRFTE